MKHTRRLGIKRRFGQTKRLVQAFDRRFMRYAIALAKQGASTGEVPVGAVVVYQGRVVGRGFNCPIATQDATAHAELVAIRAACRYFGNYRLPTGCTLYVTLEPCTMCFGAIIHSRIDRLVFGAYEPKAGVVASQENWQQKRYLNHKLQVAQAICADECAQILQQFFMNRRQQKRKKMHPIITIDGQSGSGKGTLAYRLAQHFGFRLLDSGALYRVVGWAARKQGLLSEQVLKGEYPDGFEASISTLAQGLDIAFVVNKATQTVEVVVDGVPAHDIRTETVGGYASAVSGFAGVRQALLGLQKEMAKKGGVVADGRDMGTVVFPDACAKLYLTASAKARATRRIAQLQQLGQVAVFDEILATIQQRDFQDENRTLAPSRPAVDALVLDTTDLSAEEVYQTALAFISDKIK